MTLATHGRTNVAQLKKKEVELVCSLRRFARAACTKCVIAGRASEASRSKGEWCFVLKPASRSICAIARKYSGTILVRAAHASPPASLLTSASSYFMHVASVLPLALQSSLGLARCPTRDDGGFRVTMISPRLDTSPFPACPVVLHTTRGAHTSCPASPLGQPLRPMLPRSRTWG